MFEKQRPLGTGFTAASTTDDVLKGIDLTGKHAIVTGGNAGLGLETTRALSAAGASVTIGARDPERAAAAVAGLDRVEVSRLDLLNPASVTAFAERHLTTGRPVDVLVNNAGIGAETRELDARGYEKVFATNHLGHFQLTLALLPALPGARVVTLTSGGHRLSDIRWDDLHFATGFDAGASYGQAKTANVLFTVELERRYAATGLHAYAVHPGIAVATTLARGDGMFPVEALKAMGLIDDAGEPIIDPDTERKTPKQAASTVVFAATSPLLDDIGGVYLKNNDIAPVDATPFDGTIGTAPITDVAPHALDPESARRLWELSERMVGA
ncbi:SDR family NAD(P)-dependent oxidoreductase [Lentzea sp. JNUCC 0626]|uniref:SDR family NAD(P)-dependent oxidoreductase n=1 Tax=Lentzea sp. JNUCC 0626 TaxID=3367513 RepID=UPI003748090C